MSYARITVLAIYHFHKTGDAEGALRYVRALAGKYKMSNDSRLDTEEEKITGYIAWYRATTPVVVKAKINVRLPLKREVFLAGEVSRLDIDVASGGYRALLLTDKDGDWRNELRMPILQAAIASDFKRDSDEVAIGVQHLDGSGLQTIIFTNAEIRKAEREMLRIADLVADELAIHSAG